MNRILHRASRGVVDPVPFHEFMQAVMLGDRKHYKEDLSDVINLFAVDGIGDQSHFNRIAVLSRVLSAAGEVTNKGKGFIPITEVVHDCENVGIAPETTLKIISFLVEKRLLATETLIRDAVAENACVRATSAALYYLNELVFDFSYIDQIIIDCEIGADGARETMRDLSRDLIVQQDRYKRVELRVERYGEFIRYLDREYVESSFAKAGAEFDNVGKQLVPRLVAECKRRQQEVLDNARAAFSPETT
jgi:hypothetical protein